MLDIFVQKPSLRTLAQGLEICYQLTSSILMILDSTQQPFPGETKVGFFRANEYLKRQSAKSGMGKDIMIQLVLDRSVIS
jgi:hypothetical protein